MNTGPFIILAAAKLGFSWEGETVHQLRKEWGLLPFIYPLHTFLSLRFLLYTSCEQETEKTEIQKGRKDKTPRDLSLCLHSSDCTTVLVKQRKTERFRRDSNFTSRQKQNHFVKERNFHPYWCMPPKPNKSKIAHTSSVRIPDITNFNCTECNN